MPGKLSITVGIPGSGKTFQAQRLLALGEADLTISRDGLRAELFNGEGILSTEEENYITKVQKNLVKDALRDGKHVIVHDMNLREKYRKQWASIAWNLGAEFEIIDLTSVPLADCLNNDHYRWNRGGRGVGYDVIRELHNNFIAPLKGPVESPLMKDDFYPLVPKPYAPNPYTPKGIIVDIDGTLADHTGVRNAYDTSKYHLDRPKEKVIRFVQEQHYRLGKEIILCSGRHDAFRDVTEEWIFEHVKIPFVLFMREHEGRDDSVEKLWLFDRYIRDSYNVEFVLDDRDRVVKMWRSIGLLTLQVAEGDF